MVEKRIPQIPSAEEIDAAASRYLDAQADADEYQAVADAHRLELSGMIERNGFVPARATKTRRLEGVKWKCSLSQSDSLEVDGTEAQRFFAALKHWGIGHIFSRIFNRRAVFVLAPGAQKYIESVASSRRRNYADKADELRAAFNRCLSIKSSAPGVKVEPMEKATK